MFATVTPRFNPRTYSGYGAKRPVGGGGEYGQKSKRGAKASSVMSKAKGVKAVKQTPVTIIKKVVRSLAEKKTVNTDPLLYTFNAVNSTMSPAVDLTTALTGIAQGNTDGARIGNKIRLAKYTLKINFVPTSTVVAPGAYIVQLFVGTLKQDPGKLPSATDLTRIYDDGAGTAAADGTMLSTIRDINTEYFKIAAYRKFKLGPALNGTVTNNDFPFFQEFVIDDLLKGEVIYNDALTPVNKFLFMWCTATSVYDAITVSAPVLCRYYISCQYTDI